MKQICFLRLPETLKRRGISRSQHYAEIQAGLYPPRVKLGKRSAADIEHEADAIAQARTAGLTEDQIRALVRELKAARNAA